jgi:hypothetical protein
LDCGGKRSATPPWKKIADKFTMRKRCRRCALPAQSKSCRQCRANSLAAADFEKPVLVVRRLGIVGLDAFRFHGFQNCRLTLHLFLQMLHEPALFDDHPVQLFDLMFQMSDVRFDAFEPLQVFSVHGCKSSQFFQTRQTTSAVAKLSGGQEK